MFWKIAWLGEGKLTRRGTFSCNTSHYIVWPHRWRKLWSPIADRVRTWREWPFTTLRLLSPTRSTVIEFRSLEATTKHSVLQGHTLILCILPTWMCSASRLRIDYGFSFCFYPAQAIKNRTPKSKVKSKRSQLRGGLSFINDTAENIYGWPVHLWMAVTGELGSQCIEPVSVALYLACVANIWLIHNDGMGGRRLLNVCKHSKKKKTVADQKLLVFSLYIVQ